MGIEAESMLHPDQRREGRAIGVRPRIGRIAVQAAQRDMQDVTVPCLLEPQAPVGTKQAVAPVDRPRRKIASPTSGNGRTSTANAPATPRPAASERPARTVHAFATTAAIATPNAAQNAIVTSAERRIGNLLRGSPGRAASCPGG